MSEGPATATPASPVLACPIYGGQLRLVATTENQPGVQRILAHVGLHTTTRREPGPAPADGTPAFDFPG